MLLERAGLVMGGLECQPPGGRADWSTTVRPDGPDISRRTNGHAEPSHRYPRSAKGFQNQAIIPRPLMEGIKVKSDRRVVLAKNTEGLAMFCSS